MKTKQHNRLGRFLAEKAAKLYGFSDRGMSGDRGCRSFSAVEVPSLKLRSVARSSRCQCCLCIERMRRKKVKPLSHFINGIKLGTYALSLRYEGGDISLHVKALSLRGEAFCREAEHTRRTPMILQVSCHIKLQGGTAQGVKCWSNTSIMG